MNRKINRRPRLQGNTKPRAQHTQTQTRDAVDGAFLERASVAPVPSSHGPVRLPNHMTLGFGPVRVYDAAGQLVRTISVHALRQRAPVVPPARWPW